jgi:hypothetical protein
MREQGGQLRTEPVLIAGLLATANDNHRKARPEISAMGPELKVVLRNDEGRRKLSRFGRDWLDSSD